MKILLIGYYDYSFYAGASELVDNNIRELKLDDMIFELIQDLLYSPSLLMSEQYNTVRSLFEQYDQVIVCEDGIYQLLKTSTKENL